MAGIDDAQTLSKSLKGNTLKARPTLEVKVVATLKRNASKRRALITKVLLSKTQAPSPPLPNPPLLQILKMTLYL